MRCIFRKINKLLRHHHKWQTTHTNRWQITTRKVCYRCGCVASVERFSNEPKLTYRWVYEYQQGFGAISGRKYIGVWDEGQQTQN